MLVCVCVCACTAAAKTCGPASVTRHGRQHGVGEHQCWGVCVQQRHVGLPVRPGMEGCMKLESTSVGMCVCGCVCVCAAKTCGPASATRHGGRMKLESTSVGVCVCVCVHVHARSSSKDMWACQCDQALRAAWIWRAPVLMCVCVCAAKTCGPASATRHGGLHGVGEHHC